MWVKHRSGNESQVVICSGQESKGESRSRTPRNGEHWPRHGDFSGDIEVVDVEAQREGSVGVRRDCRGRSRQSGASPAEISGVHDGVGERIDIEPRASEDVQLLSED